MEEGLPPLGVVVTAAGSSSRFGPRKKELELLPDGRSVIAAALSPFLRLSGLRALVLTAPPGEEARLRAAAGEAALALGERLIVITGGPSRRDSVRFGLEALEGLLCPAGLPEPQREQAIVLVHDGARPWASAELAARAFAAARERGAALPLIPVTDTIKQKGDTKAEGLVSAHPARAGLGAAQTPQSFRFLPLLAAHRRAAAEGFDCTDDAELWDRYVGPVAWIEGELANRKITYAADLGTGSADSGAGAGPGAAEGARDQPRSQPLPAGRAGGAAPRPPAVRVGEGWDLHRLVAGRPLMLGGAQVPAEFGEEAWSDGDVLLHAAIDALLGGAALGDIGSHFPPSDPRWKGADSRELAAHAVALVRKAGWEPLNLDCTVILEKPKLGPHREAIRSGLAAALGMELGSISVKAKTSEGVNAAGEGRAIEARAIVLLGRAEQA